MSIGINLLGGGGGGGAGIKKVANAAARLALVPTDGMVVIQLDTDVLYEYDGGTVQWIPIGGGGVILSATDSSSIDFTQTGTALTAALKLSAVAAAANNFLAGTSLQADGLRVQVAYSDVRGLFSGTAPVSYNSGTGVFSMAPSSDGVDGYFTGADHTTFTALVAASHAAVTLAAFGATPNSNGLTLSGQALNMQPADATNPGGVSIGTQSFAGVKTFVNTTDATSTSTGALITSGGLGVAKVAYIGTGLNLGSGSLGASQLLRVASTTQGSNPMPSMTTAQRTAIASPATALMVYDTDLKGAMFYDGTQWQFMDGRAVIAAAQTPANAATLTPLGYRNQVLPISGSGGAVTLTDLATTNALSGDILVLIGTSDTNTVTIVSATNTVLNGSCTLSLDATITLEFYSSKWREIARST